MKKRIISAIIALSIIIPLIINGGILFELGVYIISMLGLKEFLSVKSKEKELPFFVEIISYVIFSLFIFFNITTNNLMYKIDFRIIVGLFLVYLIPIVSYHDSNKYSIVDAFYLIGGVFFLGTSFSILILIRNISMNLLIYLLLITIITDTYAYITGRLIGRHKLLETISPNKTWEGTIGGTLFGTLIPIVFYYTCINANINLFTLTCITLFLSILAQFGDLTFSAIKRHYKVKDFSNIMPGHGGILDRCDSIIFVILGYIIFSSII